jgi:predicted ribosome quality control (RQC) complex YloA/Tae2 family protein
MFQNYYTLLKLKSELTLLIGTKLIEFFSQDKNSIYCKFYNGVKEIFLHFSSIPFCSSLYIDERFVRAKSNTVDLCNEIIGDYLQEINVAKYERIIELKFIKYSIYCYIFGNTNSNLFVCDNKNGTQNRVIFALNNSHKYLWNELIHKKGNAIDFLEFAQNKTLFEALSKSNLLLEKYYAIEFCKQNNLFENMKFDNLLESFTVSELNEIKEQVSKFTQSLISHSKVYILNELNSQENFFSLIPLNNYQIIKEFDTVSEGLKYISIQNHIEQKKKEIENELLPKLRKNFNQLTENIRHSENLDNIINRADKYRNFAELLISQPNVKQRVGEEIDILDWTGNNQKIKLDAKLTLLENSNKYFIKSRKSLKEVDIKKKRLPLLKEELVKVCNAIDRIENAGSIKDLEKIRNEFIKQHLVIMQNEERPISTKFRVFELGDGYTLYVGKNATNNDELTMKFAKPNDVWLHSRGSSGSHCVVKGGNSEDKLPKPILKLAAEIAAYYSGSKNAKYTPVCYTQKKYVHKPKGAKAGTVSLQREEIIMVEPKIPE